MLQGDGGQGFNTPMQRPACQVAGCFEPASVYVVIKESEINALKIEPNERQAIVENNSPGDINTFKLILYLCARHDYDLKYLLKENELEITKRRHLVLKETE
jgi:hypothetical protein